MVTMDETNTANSSSAAAVADGASAAARTKTVGAATIKSASHVKLLIKSSNQQYEDHVIESDLLWTVKRLKTHLSLVYPSKPPAADQKLIYSGQLLNDNVQLKDVIRSYKDVYTQNHIIHLVYTPKNLPPPPVTSSANKSKTTTSSASATGVATAGQASANNMTTADGLRQRHTAGSNSTGSQSTAASMQQQQQQLQQQQQAMFHQNMYPYFMTPQMMSTVPVTAAMNSCPQFPSALGSPYNVQAMISQQAAMYNWMQQVYSQYMQQCLRLSNTVDSSTVPSMAGTTFRPPIPPEFHQFFQQQFPSTVMPPIVPDTTNIATANIAASTDGTTPEGQQDQQQQQQQQQGQQEPAAVGQVAAPRFPNLPQDEHDNRDWLDNFFSITRLAIFLTLLYFNSSPLRCLVVVIIAGGIYLYHIGAFRLRHERNNNNLNRNNNAAQNAAVDQIRQGVDQQQNAVAAPANQGQEANNADNNDSDNDEPVEQTETTTSSDAVDNADNESMMSTIRTFVITFFTSLFPETPAL